MWTTEGAWASPCGVERYACIQNGVKLLLQSHAALKHTTAICILLTLTTNKELLTSSCQIPIHYLIAPQTHIDGGTVNLGARVTPTILLHFISPKAGAYEGPTAAAQDDQ